ncbi:MAG: 30S ribosomal protein S7 [Planctomycetota bacterium]|nr:MAG: 30S ribosomal protein S7 [Planctomycetota bacterium]
MPRKYISPAKYQRPDPKLESMLVSKFINCLMLDGKKSTAQKIFYESLDIVQQKIPDVEPLEAFTTAVANVKPIVEVRSRRVGGATLQVPHEIKRERQQALAFRWILQATRKRKGKPMARRLAEELFDAYNKQGTSYTTRENTHKMAEANKAYAHFAW